MSPIGELATLFFKLGVIGFGGPAAHIAMMEAEVVQRRQWLTRSRFLDLVGATNLIPGPNSTEMAIHVGYIYAGLPGLIVAGACFITPAVLITGVFAWIYVQFGTLPQVEPLLYGIKPAVLAVIAGALWRLGKKAIKSRQLALLTVGVAGLVGIGLNEVIALLVGGLVGMVWLRSTHRKSPPLTALVAIGTGSVAATATPTLMTPSLWKLGLFFLKIGCVLFGSGYVLIAFLEGQLVNEYRWLTSQQLLDAIAIGQFTPGPVLSTSTFIGYLILGIPGAIVATLGIFLPSFFFVLILNPLIPRLRSSSWTAAFLDAVNAGAVGLMVVVTMMLAWGTLVDIPAMIIAGLAAGVLFRFKVNAAWLVLGGAIAGGLIALI